MSETKKAETTVYSKMAQVMAEVESVKKSAHNDYSNYDYATEADILEAIRGSLVKHKLIVVPSVLHASTENEAIEKGFVTFLQMQFRIIDTENPESFLAIDWYGTGWDTTDKGAYKAMTGAVKYFLLKTFLIATNDDPERDTIQKGAEKPRKTAETEPEEDTVQGSSSVDFCKIHMVTMTPREGEYGRYYSHYVKEEGGYCNNGKGVRNKKPQYKSDEYQEAA